MSESKAEYYAKHLNKDYEHIPMETLVPTGLPTLLARMVTEFQVGLGDQSTEVHEILVRTFNRSLLASAQPLLTEYLTAITTPPLLVVKEQQEDEAKYPMMVRALLAAERGMSQQERIEIERGKRR